MTTTELIYLLKKYEFGASGRPRELAIFRRDNKTDADGCHQQRFVLNREDELVFTGSGDGCAGAQLDLLITEPSYVSINYQENEEGKFFNPKEAVKEFWGVDIDEDTDLAGLNLVIRSSPDHKDRITGMSWANGVLGVHLKQGWKPLDFVIKFYRPG
jgi:hypothetical protein